LSDVEAGSERSDELVRLVVNQHQLDVTYDGKTFEVTCA
jgi:hypothetical protein